MAKERVDEEILFEGRPAWASHWPRLLGSGLFAVLGAGLLVYQARAPLEAAIRWALLAAGGLLIANWLYALGVIAGRRLTYLYTVTTERAVLSVGLLTRRTSEVELSDVRNVTIEQSLMGRLLDYGDLGISSAGGGGIELTFVDVRHPEEVKELVRAQRRGE